MYGFTAALRGMRSDSKALLLGAPRCEAATRIMQFAMRDARQLSLEVGRNFAIGNAILNISPFEETGCGIAF